jgi:branched-chain amino acid aminotransferase
MSHSISIERVSHSRISEVNFENIQFGKNFSDHMFIADFYDGEWRDARIVPFGNISIHPATFALHYGQAIFEGLKAYRAKDGTIQVFRPEKNWERLNKSAARMCMEEVPQELFMKALDLLISVDKDWVPNIEGGSMYIRPFMFATDESVGIKPGDRFKLIIFTCPVATYYSAPVKVLITDKFVRAVKGGVGSAKAAGNYAATMYPVKLARAEGYDQILWTDPFEFRWVQEIGTMNVFFQFGDNTVVTPTLEDGTILDGVTRDSLITLLKSKGYNVEERRISIDEIFEHHANGTLKDAFGAGTAATVAPIAVLGNRGKQYNIADYPERLCYQLKKDLEDIRYSRVADSFGWMHKVEELAAV